jgi:hypothetical protein
LDYSIVHDLESDDTCSALQGILNHLPANIKEALEAYAGEIEMPIEFVIEMAIASFLDLDSTTFADCRMGSPGQMREQIEILQLQLAAVQGNSAR